MQSTLPLLEMLDAAQRHPQYCLIPSYTLEALHGYINEGIPTGGFLDAVLSDKLFEALRCGDNQNLEALVPLTYYIYNECPSKSWGSRYIIDEYTDRIQAYNAKQRQAVPGGEKQQVEVMG